MIQKNRNTFVLNDPTEILEALVGLKNVRVLAYERRASDVQLHIERVVDDVRCPRCRHPARVKERPIVTYVDLPVYGTPMKLVWKKHRMRCVNERLSPPELGAQRPPDRGQELPAHHEGGQVGDASRSGPAEP